LRFDTPNLQAERENTISGAPLFSIATPSLSEFQDEAMSPLVFIAIRDNDRIDYDLLRRLRQLHIG